MNSVIRCAFQRAFISKPDGMTLIEVIAALSIAAVGFLGLGTIYVFGWDSWNKTQDRMLVQQEGTHGIELLAEKIQGADTLLDVSGSGLTVRYPKETGKKNVRIVWQDRKIFMDDEQIVPYGKSDTMVQVVDFEVPLSDDSLAQITMALEIRRGGWSERMNFSTDLFKRNLKKA